jgi:hypothetical protein
VQKNLGISGTVSVFCWENDVVGSCFSWGGVFGVRGTWRVPDDQLCGSGEIVFLFESRVSVTAAPVHYLAVITQAETLFAALYLTGLWS